MSRRTSTDGPETGDDADARRLAALARYDLLDAGANVALDRITSLTARVLDAPMALVTLVDSDRIWFASRWQVTPQQVGRDPGLCTSAIEQDELWIVEDARNDPRTRHNPLVTGPLGVRFYAGVPLRVRSGETLGMLCILDEVPRGFDDQRGEILRALGAITVDAFELRLQTKRIFEMLADADRDLRETRRRADAGSERIAALEELDATRRTFLRTVSHDLITPLVTIRGMAELLELPEGQLDGARRDELVTMIRENASHLHDVVSEVLAKERFSQPGAPLRPAPLDVAALAREVAARPHLRDAPIAIGSEDLVATVDAAVCERVLDNLLSNAQRHAPEATVIDVALRPGPRGGLVITVSDDGPGISESARRRILEAFGDDAGVAGGSGLGLSLVNRMATLHGGSVTLGSDPSGGASITVSLAGDVVADRPAPTGEAPTTGS